MVSTSGVNGVVPNVLRKVYLAVIALIPVHALISVWLSARFGLAEVWQGWKEAALALGLLLLFGFVLFKRRDTLEILAAKRINRLIAAYVVLQVVLWAVMRPPVLAALVGLAIDLRFFAIFLIGQALVEWFDAGKLKSVVLKIVMLGGVLAVGFGALQALVLPPDILRYVGYGPNTIESYRTIDENPDLIRINSTLRGPSPLGLYLVLIAALLAARWFKRPGKAEDRRQTAGDRWPFAFVSFAALVTLYATYSRAAWLGAVIAAAGVLFMSVSGKVKKRIWVIGLAGAVIGGVLVAGAWQTDFVQQTVLHRDPTQGVDIDSDDERFAASGRALADIIDNPLGGGPGSAGPASFYGGGPARIAENYYLQIAQETGVIGLVLFLFIIWEVGKILWRQRRELVPRALFASLLGLSAANLFLHGWAQDEIALIWWGLAGLYIKDPVRINPIGRNK